MFFKLAIYAWRRYWNRLKADYNDELQNYRAEEVSKVQNNLTKYIWPDCGYTYMPKLPARETTKEKLIPGSKEFLEELQYRPIRIEEEWWTVPKTTPQRKKGTKTVKKGKQS